MLKPGDGNSERLKQAVRLHQAGRLEEAEAIYQALLQEEPDQAEILNVSGALACQRKDFAGAIRRISQAMALAPQAPDYVCNLAKVYYQQGQLEQAIDSFLAVLDLAPQHREARRNLAALYQARGENQLALAQYQALVAIDPQDASACNNLGNLLLERGEPESAAAYYLQALQAQPEHLNARNNLGKIRLLQGRLPEALAAFEQVLKLRPDHLQALFQAGISLQSMNRYPEALVYYVRAEQLEPGNAKIQLNLAVSLFTLGRDAEALHHCRAALRLEPDNPDIHSNLGLIQERQGRISEALASYHRALELQPDDARIHNNQGNAYRAQGKLEQALAAYRRALALRPDYPIAHRNLLLTLNYLPHLTADEIFAEHRAWGQQTERYYLPASGHANLPDSGRCLRVGYVSSVFRHHAVAFFVEPVLTAHDRQQVEVFCYADLIAPDAVTRRLQAHADHWREIQTLDTRAVAALIRQDRIDILVDLDGHTAHNRLEVFALKPAPVQVSYVGYPNTTGLGTMDYRITDAWADPVGQNDEFYTEQLLRLPRNFSCYAPPAESPEVAALPALT
ncbi:MAG TPA: tetratricopeptide repeat protein, partial [Candidatus Obscuribacterales bacterium]